MYAALMSELFAARYKSGATTVSFTRQELLDTAKKIGVDLPKNVGDVVYSGTTTGTHRLTGQPQLAGQSQREPRANGEAVMTWKSGNERCRCISVGRSFASL